MDDNGEETIKILFVQLLEYLFTPGGAHKANRLIMEGLAALGHDCRVISGGPEAGAAGMAKIREQIHAKGMEYRQLEDEAITFDLNGVTVDAVTDSFLLFKTIRERVRSFSPDVVIVSEDPTFLMLETAVDAGANRIVYLAHSQATLPFGPASFERNAQRTRLMQKVDGVMTVSRYVARYIEEYGGMRARVIYSPVYGKPPFARFGGPDQGAVTMINPSRIKGLDIFLALARALPHLPFAAIPTWATTKRDLADLKEAGVAIIPPENNMDDVLCHMRMLLVPSLWGEAFGQVVVETMLRGVPVLASDLGGLPDAKLGVPYLLPVREIEAYEDRHDERNVQIPILPPQDIQPWVEALTRLTSDHQHYHSIADQSRQAALEFVTGLDIEAYADYMNEVLAKPAVARQDPQKNKRDEVLQKLTPQQRALLARRLKKKSAAAVSSNP